MPERIIQRARNFTPNLYFTVPFETKKKFDVKRGSQLKCAVLRVMDGTGNILQTVNKEITCKVAKRDGRFYIPPKLIQQLNLLGTEYYEILMLNLVKTDGKEVEINPNETRIDERYQAIKSKE